MAVCASFQLLTVGSETLPVPVLAADLTHTEITCTDYILQTATEYHAFDLESLFNTYFALDPVIFSKIVGAVIVSYALGHSVGSIVKLMNRT